MASTEFTPAHFLRRVHDCAAQGRPSAQDRRQEQDWCAKPALLILNQPVSNVDVLQRLWACSGYRLCADGGANRLHDTFHSADGASQRREQFLPNIIHGDLDSLRGDVREWYAERGVIISHDPDQYSTDFGKGVKQINAAVPPATASGSRREILVLGTLAGRVDQGLGILYDLLRIQNAYPDIRLWLFSETSVSFILPPGINRIVTPVVPAGSSKEDGSSGFFMKKAGILPAYGPATISTSGFEWDVTDWPTSVDGNISTSNHVQSDVVTIKTDVNVLFTIQRAPTLP